MDLFGIGAAELIVIGLVILVIAGPQRSAAWARQAGIYLRQFQQAWSKMMDEFRKELGPEGEQFTKAAQEITRTASQVRQAVSPNIVGKANRLVEKAATDSQQAALGPLSSSANGDENAGNETQAKFSAWLPAGSPAAESTPKEATAEEERFSAWKPDGE